MDSGGKVLILSILIALLAGVGIVFFNKEYRFDKISKTNESYYPGIKILSETKVIKGNLNTGGDE